jgi:hypothetical protein
VRAERTTILSWVGQARATIRDYLFQEVVIKVTCEKVLRYQGAVVPLPGSG